MALHPTGRDSVGGMVGYARRRRAWRSSGGPTAGMGRKAEAQKLDSQRWRWNLARLRGEKWAMAARAWVRDV